MTLDPRTPVLVGVGTCFDDVEAAEMLVRSVEAAAEDAGVADLLPLVGRIAVPRGTWAYADPARFVRDRIGAPSAKTVLVEIGIPQQTIIDETLAAIRDGAVDVAVVAGAEAKARAARLQNKSTKGDAAGMADVFRARGTAEGVVLETDQGDAVPDEHQHPTDMLVDHAELAAGLWAPVDQYALMESALGAAEGRSPDELRDDVSALYARFNEVAVANPEAAFRDPMSADELRTFSGANRPMSFPYGKWHVTQWTVDQAAALLFTTVEVAERLGVPRERWVLPVVGLSSSLTQPLTQRAALYEWPAMEVLGAAAERHLGRTLASLDLHELYSCFPVAVRIQQRALGLPLDGTPTVTGGMSFAGGPFNSYVIQSLTTMAHRLHEHGGYGVITSVSGLLTKPGLGVWTTDLDGAPPLLVADLVDEASAVSPSRRVVSSADGPVRVLAATVTHQGHEPNELVVIAEAESGERVIATSGDSAFREQAMTAGLVGRTMAVRGNELVAP